MLLNNTECLCNGTFLVALILMACAGYAYRIDARRPDDDPKKRNYPPLAIVFAPITFPFFAVLSLLILIMRVLMYGVFLLLFPIALVAIRQPFLLLWLRKAAIFVGNKLLDANTILARLLLKPRAVGSEVRRATYRVDPLFSRFV